MGPTPRTTEYRMLSLPALPSTTVNGREPYRGSAGIAYNYRAAVTYKKMWLRSVLEGCVGAHLPDVEFGFESMRRVDVQSKGGIIDGRPDRSGCRTPPPAPPAATRVTRLRGPKWPSFGACSLSHLQSST